MNPWSFIPYTSCKLNCYFQWKRRKCKKVHRVKVCMSEKWKSVFFLTFPCFTLCISFCTILSALLFGIQCCACNFIVIALKQILRRSFSVRFGPRFSEFPKSSMPNIYLYTLFLPFWRAAGLLTRRGRLR